MMMNVIDVIFNYFAFWVIWIQVHRRSQGFRWGVHCIVASDGDDVF